MTVSRVEAQAIAEAAAREALDRHKVDLPTLLKPLMFEVAESVSKRNDQGMRQLFNMLFGVNVDSPESVRLLQQDIYWTRDTRINSESQRKALTSQALSGALRLVFAIAGVGILAFFGFKVVGI